jgi:threonine dehydrogenase-like Zn-dependent dehydrogenase
MKALRFEDQRLSVRDVPQPDDPKEALVKVSLSGICNTDIEIVRGYAGFNGSIGHEFVGIVERDDEHTDLIGARVVGEINAGCGSCARCLDGDPRHCPNRTVLGIVGRDGAHAEYLNIPAVNLLRLPDNVSDEKAVFVEPLAAALGITEQVRIERTTRVAVIGDGKLGLLCAMSLALSSERVSLFGHHREKMKIAENVGIGTFLSTEIHADMHRSFDMVVEASGSESGFATALDLVRPRGKIVLKSTFQGDPSWEASRVVVDEITIVGSRCGRFEPAIDLLSSGKIDPTPMISATFPLEDGVKAMNRAKEKGVLKVLLRP